MKIIASDPITSWQIDGETVETVADFIFLGSKITADSDCSHEITIEFETVSGAPENYDPQVLTASDSLYRFIHEYKANWWERADMRRIGTINPSEKAIIKNMATKRKGDEPIFQF